VEHGKAGCSGGEGWKMKCIRGRSKGATGLGGSEGWGRGRGKALGVWLGARQKKRDRLGMAVSALQKVESHKSD